MSQISRPIAARAPAPNSFAFNPLAVAPLMLCLGLLAGCGDDAKPAAQGTAAASSSVQAGTISDEMLPVDTLTSQPPLMAEEVAKPADGGVDRDGVATPSLPAEGGTGTQAEPDTDTAPAARATPVAAASPSPGATPSTRPTPSPRATPAANTSAPR